MKHECIKCLGNFLLFELYLADNSRKHSLGLDVSWCLTRVVFDIDTDTDTYNYIELCDFFKSLVVPRVSVRVIFGIRIRASYANIINELVQIMSLISDTLLHTEQNITRKRKIHLCVSEVFDKELKIIHH